MSFDVFSERRFPGDSRPPGHWRDTIPGEWEDFDSVILPGAELRCRLLYDARSALLAGNLVQLPAEDEILLGYLAPVFQPATPKRFLLAIGELRIGSDGAVWLRVRAPLSDASFRAVYALA